MLWGSGLGPAVRARHDARAAAKRFAETVDGQFQTFAANDGAYNREHFFSKYPELQALVAHMTDAEIDRLQPRRPRPR